MVMAVLHDFSPLVEQASVDEAYMDVTGLEKLFGPPEQLGAELKRRVREATGLNCSVGIAPVKFLAKIASDYRKPDGLFVLRPEDVQEFLRQLHVGKIPGVGKHVKTELDKLGIRFAADILRYPPSFWEGRFGKWGSVLYERAQGLGSTTVSTHYEAKSESAENTFSRDTVDREELKRWLLHQAERVGARLRRHRYKGRTVTLKIKFQDFSSITRSKTLPEPTSSTRTIFETAAALLDAQALPKKVRLIGVGVSNFHTAPTQLPLFQDKDKARDEHLDLTLDAIREKFGSNALVRGRIFGFRNK